MMPNGRAYRLANVDMLRDLVIVVMAVAFGVLQGFDAVKGRRQDWWLSYL